MEWEWGCNSSYPFACLHRPFFASSLSLAAEGTFFLQWRNQSCLITTMNAHSAAIEKKSCRKCWMSLLAHALNAINPLSKENSGRARGCSSKVPVFTVRIILPLLPLPNHRRLLPKSLQRPHRLKTAAAANRLVLDLFPLFKLIRSCVLFFLDGRNLVLNCINKR